VIKEIKTKKDHSNQQVIDHLEEIVEMAKSGQILSIGICGTLTGGKIYDGMSGGHDTASLLGASVMMQDRIKKKLERCKEIITEEHKRYQYQSNVNTSNKIRSGKTPKK
jgi:hypothetical protein